MCTTVVSLRLFAFSSLLDVVINDAFNLGARIECKMTWMHEVSEN